MSIKNLGFSTAAVLVAMVMSLGLMAGRSEASVNATTLLTFAAMALPTEAELNDGTTAAGTMSSNASGAYTASATNLVLTESTAAQLGNGTIVVNVPSGWRLQDAGTCTSSNADVTCTPTLNSAGTQLTWTVATAGSGAARTLTSGSLELRPTSNTAAAGSFTIDASSTQLNVATLGGGLTAGQVVGTVAAPTAYGTNASPYSVNLSMVSTTTACGTTNPVTTVSATTTADGAGALALCAAVRAASGAPVANVPVLFTVSSGIVSTGTGKSVTAITNAAGNATTNYRGGGNVAVTDTAVASVSSLNAVGTLAVTLTAPGGTTAAKIVVSAPSNTAVAPTIVGTAANYVTTQVGADLAIQVQDSAGLGVNGQALLVSVDRGTVIDNPAVAASIAASCAAATAKSTTTTTASTNLTARGGSATPGYANVVICGSTADAVGKITVTVSNVTTTMANATATLSQAGVPSKITATASGNVITAKVTDAGGNVVADGTPVRFAISANAGVVSVGCTTSTNGEASSVAALVGATGTVIVSTDWSESGGAATCAGAGAKSIAASVAVPGGTAASGTASTPSATAISSGSVPAAGGFGLIVAGGPLSGLAPAACPASASTAAFWATVNGDFVTYVPGTSIAAVNAAFNAAFPNGLPSGTPLTAKCK